MKTVNYKFNGEIQKHIVYTREEILDEFKIRENDIDGQTFWIDYATARMDQHLSRSEQLNILTKSIEKLKDMLCEEEYLDIEKTNIAHALLNINALTDTLKNHDKIWANVIE